MSKDKSLKLSFPKLGHFWFDAGLVGLTKILDEIDKNKVEVVVEQDQLNLYGHADDIQRVLEKAYDTLIDRFYNLSTKKQKDDISSYNFYYDRQKDTFVKFPKRKSVGIAQIIYNKAPRPTGDSIKWVDKIERTINYNGKTVKKTRGILPAEYAYLQTRLDKFLDENGLDVTTSGLLVDGPNAVKPNVSIQITGKKKNKNKRCYLCGAESESLDDANQTIFPFITGASGILSFNSEIGKPEKICWKCSFLGKFVPAVGFYSVQREHLYAFLPYSVSLERMCDLYDILQDSKVEDPNLYHNFEHPLGGYYQHPYETAFAFFYTLYDKLRTKQIEKTGEEELDYEELLDLNLSHAPIEFYVIHTQEEGSTFAGKLIWPFKEIRSFFRLMQEIEKSTKFKMKEILFCCIDFSEKNDQNKTLIRNKICERILKKQSILDLVERHVFHSEVDYFKPLVDMVLVYEQILREGDEMYKEEQEAAVSLGKCIGMAVGKSENGKKGDLYALRKARRKVDFLEQLNRLQFRLQFNKGSEFTCFNVPKEVYEGKLTDQNFQEFKQYCLIAALNCFNTCKK